MRGGSVAIFVLVVVLLIGVVLWWVRQGAPGLLLPTNGHVPVRAALDANPLQGMAPLTVTFSIRRDIGTVQTVSYGDGTSAEIADFICGPSSCVRLHTYQEAGIYTASYEDPSNEPVRSFSIKVEGL